MNPLVAIRIECLRLAVQRPEPDVIATATAMEKHVRRGISRADLAGGCGCGKRADSADAQRKRQMLLHEDVRALIDPRMAAMTLSQLITDPDLLLAPDDAHAVNERLARMSLRTSVTGADLQFWVQHGRLPGARGKAYTPPQ